MDPPRVIGQKSCLSFRLVNLSCQVSRVTKKQSWAEMGNGAEGWPVLHFHIAKHRPGRAGVGYFVRL